jgi:hypothetical protein
LRRRGPSRTGTHDSAGKEFTSFAHWKKIELKIREWNAQTHNAIHAWPGSLEDVYQSREIHRNIHLVDVHTFERRVQLNPFKTQELRGYLARKDSVWTYIKYNFDLEYL